MKELVVEKENLKHNLKIINEIISKDKKKAKKKADIQADKECENNCFCEQDLNKSKLNKLEHDKLTKEEYKRKQLRNAFIMSEVLSEPMCKKRHKR